MNKLFTKVASLGLGLAMAVGVGVAVASNSKEAEPVHAASAQWQLVTAAPSDWSGEYILGNGTSGKIKIMDGSTFSSNSCAGVDATVSSSKITADEADAITIAKSSTSGKYTVKLNGKYIGKNANSNGIDANATWSSNLDNDITYSSSKVVIKGNGGRVLTWYASNSNFRYYASSNNNSQLYKKVESKTLSSISVSGGTTAFTVGDTFTFGGTVTAHYSDSSSANVTSSATFSGYNMNTAGNYTVTASYSEGGVTKTATYGITVSAPTTPTISLNGSSFTGYTGQSFSVTATYSNLSSAFAWSTSGAGTTTETIDSTGTSTDGTSTYSGTLTGAGTKTITATGGGASSASYTVNITKTTVDITKTSTSIAVGRSETLAASHNASSVGGLNWTSSNDSVAAVGSDGKVTVASGATVGATVTITATSTVDTSVSDTCTVTVTAAPLDTTYDFVTNFSSYNTGWGSSYGTHTGINGKTQVGGAYAATIDLYYASKQTGTITDRPVMASKTGSGSWAKVVGFTLTEPNYKIGDVSVTFSQWTTKTPDIALFSGDSASGTPLDSGTVGTKNTISTTGLNATKFTVGYCDKNTGSNVQAGLTSIYITLVKDNALDHVTVSFASDPADRTFYAGSNFAFNGTLTASYTVDSDKSVTPSGYFLEGEEGTGDAITTSDILNVADHNGADVYVQYKEGGVTKYGTFTLVVNPALATSVTLSANADSVALEEVFKVSSITATVNPEEYATQGVTWDIYDLDGLTSSDYAYSNGEFMASKPADVVFHVKANSNNSVYAEFTLTITGDPIAHLLDGSLIDVTDGSATVFGDEGILTYGVTTENFEGTISYGWSTSNSSVIAIDDDQGDMCDFEVKGPAGLARLSCHVTGSTKGDVTVYIDVTVTAVTVTSVTWTAPTIDVYSGTSLSSTSGWNVKYSTNSGKTDQTPDSFKVMLGGSEISLPHEWTAADNGKTLGVQVGGVNSSTTTVAVTQSIQSVMANEVSTWDHTFTAKAWSAAGDWTISEKLWTMSGTDDGTPYFGYDATKGQQFGSGSHPYSDVSLQSSAFSGTVDSVTVYTSGANSINATVQVSVGGTAYGSAQKITNTNTPYTFDLGGKSGTISIDYVNSSSKAIYIKEIVVNTATGSHDIANSDEHKAAQRVAVAYAMAFNEAMDDTAYCTTGLDDAWAECSSAYNTFKSAAAALGSIEEAYAKSLIKHATVQWTEDTDEDYSYCIERMLKTYEECVNKHGKSQFMDDLITLGAPRTSNLNVLRTSGNVAAVVTVVSLIGATAVGGYFFLRKRKETN